MPRKSKEKVDKLNIDEIKEAVPKTKNSTKSKTATKSTKKAKDSCKSSAKTMAKSTKKVKDTSKSSAKTVTKSKSKTKNSTTMEVSPVIVTEYYDLPFRYNQTIVKILAQTPNKLFIYWDISDKDKNAYIQKYGNDFFEHTKPYLIITNQTMNYSFEVEINDFANSWYLHINDPDCEYKVELGRKFIQNTNSYTEDSNKSTNNYVYVASSNEIDMPNNHILFDEIGDSVFFRNVKTNITQKQDVSSISFLQKIGKIYNIYDLYKKIYKNEFLYDEFGLNLPSSHSNFIDWKLLYIW